MKKQLKEERLRKRELKKRLGALQKEVPDSVEELEEEENASGAVAVPMPDMALPPSFDSDNPSYRYRYLDTANEWLVRPVLETHGWDHDCGYDGLNIEKTFVIAKKIPASLSGQLTKDKKESTVQMEGNAAFKSGNGKVTLAGVDIQTIGKDLAYTLRGETRFDNFKKNRTSCGLAVTLLGDAISAGMKLEDKLTIGKVCKLVVNGGAMTGRGDVAYGGSLEASLKDKDYPIEQTFSTLGLSLMNWHGDLAVGGNLQIQFKLGHTLVGTRANLNNRGTGQITIRANSSEQVQMALIALVPLLRTCLRKVLSSGEAMQ
jgi:Toc86/159 family protein import component